MAEPEQPPDESVPRPTIITTSRPLPAIAPQAAHHRIPVVHAIKCLWCSTVLCYTDDSNAIKIDGGHVRAPKFLLACGNCGRVRRLVKGQKE